MSAGWVRWGGIAVFIGVALAVISPMVLASVVGVEGMRAGKGGHRCARHTVNKYGSPAFLDAESSHLDVPPMGCSKTDPALLGSRRAAEIAVGSDKFRGSGARTHNNWGSGGSRRRHNASMGPLLAKAIDNRMERCVRRRYINWFEVWTTSTLLLA